jgi:hypothetical protein
MEKDSILKNIRQSKLLWVILVAAFLMILLVVLSPYLIKLGIEHTLTRAGNEQSKVEDVDFDLLSSTLVVHGLSATQKGGNGLEVRNITIDFELGPFSIRGLSSTS